MKLEYNLSTPPEDVRLDELPEAATATIEETEKGSRVTIEMDISPEEESRIRESIRLEQRSTWEKLRDLVLRPLGK